MKTEPEYPTAPEDEAEMNRRQAETREAGLTHLEESSDDDDLEPEETAEDALERQIALADYLRDDMRDREFDGRNSPGFYPESEDADAKADAADRLIDRADMLRDERRDG
jgi:hypothetical protein